MHINQFRALENLTIDIGEKLTLIGGINGVGKSSILGMLAQICSFKVYKELEETEENEKAPNLYRTIYGNSFESDFGNHFRISEKFDTPDKEYKVEFDINDALEELVYKATLQSAESKGDSSCSYIKFAETWCIPSDLYENVKEEFNRY